MQGINDSFKYINTKFKAVKELNSHLTEIELEAVKNNEEDGSREFLSRFYEEAQNQIIQLEVKIKKIEDNFMDLVGYYGENPDTSIDLFFEIFIKFNIVLFSVFN